MPEQSDCPTDDKLLPYTYFYHNACIYARDFDALQLLEMAVHKIENARAMLHSLCVLQTSYPIPFNARYPSLLYSQRHDEFRKADILLEEAVAYVRVAIKKMKGPAQGAIEK